MNKDELPQPQKDATYAKIFVASIGIVGLSASIITAALTHYDIPLTFYAVFGGLTLGTDNILKLIRSIFRVGGDK